MIVTPHDFAYKLQWGQVGETAIAMWLRSRGWNVLPVYETVLNTGKGPRLYTAQQSMSGLLVAPDMLAIKDTNIMWTEGKRKSHFSFYEKNGGSLQDGIDVRHYQHYLHVREETKLPLWLLFLHECDQPYPSDRDRKGCPGTCPTGLYGNEINFLKTVVDHEDKFEAKGRSYPMVYWQIKHLKPGGKPLATLEEIIASQKNYLTITSV